VATSFWDRLAGWLSAHRRAVLAVAVVAAVTGGLLASRLSVQSDISHLLPPTELSVRHLRALEKRAQVFATYQIGVESDDGAARARAAEWLRERFQRIDRDLVASVLFDDRAVKRFGFAHRFLYADIADLEAARDALRAELRAENPLLVPLDGEASPDQKLRSLEDKLARAEREANATGGMVSADGRLQMILVRTTFTSGDLDRGEILTAQLESVIAEAGRTFPSVSVGMTGDVITTRAEQLGLIHGMVLATAITVALVFAALLAFYRSLAGVGALLWALTVGTLMTFGFTQLAIGHLNIATAFLSSIVVGNGINFGLILMARYFDERRRGALAEQALATAFAGTAHGTIAAALAAGAAYVSLVITPFRGFRHFGVIGGAGMVLCWITAYTVLPAALLTAERRGWLRAGPEPPVGAFLDRVLPRRPRPVALAATALLVAVALGAWRYLTTDPLETNLRNLASHSTALDDASAWMDKFDKKFGHGISGGFVIAVPRREDAAPLVARLRAVDEGKPERARLFSQVSGLDDLLPHEQPRKLALLAEIRRLIDRVAPRLDGDARAKLERLRPPADLAPLRDADLPADIVWPYTERDGTRGRLILANNGLGIDSWNTHDLQRFAYAVRGLGLPPDVLVGGTAFVFSDMLAAMERDGPRATALAAIGAVLVVLLAVGPRIEGGITLFCGALGTLTLLTAAAAVGLKVNFLDFVALPITIGIGIDYAVNIVARARHDPAALGTRRLYETSAAVLLCSYTTTVGYGSLLLSQNKGIRSFGLGAMLGEVTCLTTALLVAPALLRVIRRRT
jgi:predicted RND superfamily exporter protein